ncbi:DUF3126 family protein [Magnetospira sp. QH-2]|uniref:DUF3126 family protein n=1 Tax=Magnetospira sp. (strain QH-2) TaxID=1288970 RepID=UPI0003E80ED1|nr:DUF3126 family protein [Magnetospira sp. QH-2]CCQ75261.1 conserved protein of unknown function [Magnetospira sp. QH-2]
MKPDEIGKVQSYLRKTFNNNSISIAPPAKPSAPVEVSIGEEFIGVLHRDEEDGEVSFQLLMTILDIDLEDV